MGPGSITRYARPARLWRIGTEPSARIRSMRQNGERVDALRTYASASKLSYAACERSLVTSRSPAEAYVGSRLSVVRIGEAGDVPHPVRAPSRIVPLPRAVSHRIGLSLVALSGLTPRRTDSRRLRLQPTAPVTNASCLLPTGRAV
jgi:hypothetical protein